MWPDTSGSGDLFGLAGSFPQPGWVVIDAARHHRYTGELVFFSSPPTRVYFDGGRLYYAERINDPSIGARLVDAGVVTAAQIEWGTIRAGGADHLGRLFDRVPNLDRDAILVTAELLTEECVRWLAMQPVPGVEWGPYRHHPSGMHAWSTADSAAPAPAPAPPMPRPFSVPRGAFTSSAPAWAAGAMATDPVGFPPPPPPPPPSPVSTVEPAPVPPVDEVDEAPVPAPVTADVPRQVRSETDDLVEWEEASWFDDLDQPDAAEDSETADPWPEPAEEDAVDWVARLEREGLPDPDPYRKPSRLPKLPVEPIERFEIVWPTGEVDEDFGAIEPVTANGHDPDQDRVATAPRLGRLDLVSEEVTIAPATQTARTESTPSGDETAGERVGTRVSPSPSAEAGTDEVVLAVRRAVASVEAGSLADRRRVANTTGVVTRAESLPAPSGPSTSQPEPGAPDDSTADEDDDAELVGDRRTGALRRLITSLRR